MLLVLAYRICHRELARTIYIYIYIYVYTYLSESPASYQEYPTSTGKALQATHGIFDMPKTVMIGLIPLALKEPPIVEKDESGEAAKISGLSVIETLLEPA